VAPLFVDEEVEFFVTEEQTVVGRNLREHARIIQPEVTVPVLLLRQRDAPAFENRLLRAQVEQLGVGEDAVEVEHDAFNHVP
jgi:hypothetical protein